MEDKNETKEEKVKKRKEDIEELEKYYLRENISIEEFNRLERINNSYPGDETIMIRFKLDCITFLNQLEKEKKWSEAVRIADILYRNSQNYYERELNNQIRQIAYCYLRLESFEISDLIYFQDLFSKNPEDAEVKELYNAYKKKVLEYLRKKNRQGIKGHEYPIEYLFNLILPIFQYDGEVGYYLHEYELAEDPHYQ